jgi:S-formylglutathione hydrolase FrmB
VAVLALLVGIGVPPAVALGRAPSAPPVPVREHDDEGVGWRIVARYVGGSHVVEERFWSAAVGREARYRLFVPPGYFVETRRYPVVYLLHGVAGDATEWQELGILEAADRLIGAGAIAPMLIALPDGGPNYWVNHADGPRWGDFVLDVVWSVDAHYRTVRDRDARAIGGLSMGGEGALRLALLHPETFAIAAAHAPSLRTSYDQLSEGLQALYGGPDRCAEDEPTPSEAYGVSLTPCEARWRSVSPYWLVRDTDAAERLTIALDVGEDDPWRENVEALHARLVRYGIDHELAILPGEHDPSYWEANLGRYLRFYDRAFAARSAAG